MQIKATNRLTDVQITQIRHLGAQCQCHDGTKGTLFLDSAVNFHVDMPCFFLCCRDETLLGLVSVFAPRETLAEISAYVHPTFRRQGLFKLMLHEALASLRNYQIDTVLFVHEHNGGDAGAMIHRWPVQWEHAEYFLTYSEANAKPLQQRFDALLLRPAEKDDIKRIAALSDMVFQDSGAAESMVQKSFDDKDVLCSLAMWQDEIIGVCNVRILQDELYIFGFGISPAFQNKGIGRAMLYDLIDRLRVRQRKITLEVDRDNQRAFHLYTSSGFSITTQFDYYKCRLADLLPLAVSIP